MIQITEKELKANIVYKTRTPFGNRFAYYKPTPSDVLVCIHGCKIPLGLNQYGFPDTRSVRVNKRGRVTGFSPRKEEAYAELFTREEVPLNAALETIAGAVNGSMEYDAQRVLSRSFLYGKGILGKGLRDSIRYSGYTPDGDETVKGVCADAGNLIRELFKSGLEDPALRFSLLVTETNISTHSTTLVFDTQTGNWVVVNSKSPLKPYNLVPREKLEDLGKPFVR